MRVRETKECIGLREFEGQSFAIDEMEGNYLKGFSLHYQSDDKALSLHVVVECDPEASIWYLHYEDNVLTFSASKACPVYQVDTLTFFLNKQAYMLGAALINGGFFIAFFGNKFVEIVIGMVGFLSSSVIFMVLAFYMLTEKNDGTEDNKLWAIVAACLLLGLLVGFLLVKARIGLALLSAWGGITLGFILNTTFVVSNKYGFLAIIIGCVLGSLYATFKTKRFIIMVSTALIGSHIFIKGISCYAGGYPNEGSIRA